MLSLSSDFFAEVFDATSNVGKHPVLILKDISKHVFELLLRYIYLGEVTIAQENIDALLSAAESLQIKGLCHVKGIGKDNSPEGTVLLKNAAQHSSVLSKLQPIVVPPDQRTSQSDATRKEKERNVSPASFEVCIHYFLECAI